MTMKVSDARLRNGGMFIFNPSFENSHNATQPVTTVNRWIDNSAAGSVSNDVYGWYFQSGTGFAFMDRSIGHNGFTSLHVGLTTENSVLSVTNLSDITKTRIYAYPVKPLTQYKVGGWMKTQYNLGTITTDVGARIEFYERNTNGIFQAQTNTPLVAQTTGWKYYETTLTTQASTTCLSIKHSIIGDQGGQDLLMEAWFDDLFISLATPPNRVTSGNRITSHNRIRVT